MEMHGRMTVMDSLRGGKKTRFLLDTKVPDTSSHGT